MTYWYDPNKDKKALEAKAILRAETFWAHVQIADSGCWLWNGKCDPDGYGRYGHGTRPAHRVAFELAHGTVPKLLVLHSCDVRNCVNPAHLREGTQKENIREAQAKGRMKQPRRGRAGEIRTHGPLTPSQVR